MFENLDDPMNPDPTPAPLDGVVSRGRRLRARRHAIAGGAVALVLLGAIGTAAALQGGSHKKVIVSDESTSTTAPSATTTTSPTPQTVVLGPLPTDVITPVPVDTTTSTPSKHPGTDYSMLSVVWPADTVSSSPGCPGATPCNNVLAIPAGATRQLTYTVINHGGWEVDLNTSDCEASDMWAQPATSGWPPYSAGIWPRPYPTRGYQSCFAVGSSAVIPAGASRTLTVPINAGYFDNETGTVIPSAPGFTSYQPPFVPPCAQPCTSYPHNSLAVTVLPPQTPSAVYTITVKTKHLDAASGQSAPVEMTYTNPLPIKVRMPVWGPCWTVKSGTATVDCSGTMPAVIIGPHQTVDLVGTIWARKGFTATGAPLTAGRYPVDLGDLQSTAYSFSAADYVYLYVTT